VPTVTATDRAARVRLLLFDVDGVLTDATTVVDASGHESLRFSVRDGLGIVCAQRAGLATGVVSARDSAPTAHRAAHLAMKHVRLGVEDKLATVKALAAGEGLELDQVAFVGDDLVDLPVLGRVGFAAAPADAVAEVRERAHLVCAAPGGRGAAREVVEFILKAQDRWSAVVAGYASRGASA
jgi:3-deoxy-D-manno-octulosonate 8-phosphate phosphatase (KDO 8-P phosphatase)